MLHVAGHLHRLWATHLRLPRGLTCHWRMVVPVIVQMRFVVTANGLRLHAAVSIMVVRGLHMWLLPRTGAYWSAFPSEVCGDG